jgi:hypothetical protein
MRSQVLTQKQIEKYRMDQKTATKIEQISLILTSCLKFCFGEPREAFLFSVYPLLTYSVFNLNGKNFHIKANLHCFSFCITI